MDETEIKERCFFCNRLFHFGNHKYYGEYVAKYKLSICSSCKSSNHDGLNPSYNKKFEDHLKTNNIPIPERNAKGWYPVPNAKSGGN